MKLRVIRYKIGGKKGYKFEVEKFDTGEDRYIYIGEIKDFSMSLETIVNLDGALYEIVEVYDRRELLTDAEQEVKVFVLLNYVHSIYELEWK